MILSFPPIARTIAFIFPHQLRRIRPATPFAHPSIYIANKDASKPPLFIPIANKVTSKSIRFVPIANYLLQCSHVQALCRVHAPTHI